MQAEKQDTKRKRGKDRIRKLQTKARLRNNYAMLIYHKIKDKDLHRNVDAMPSNPQNALRVNCGSRARGDLTDLLCQRGARSDAKSMQIKLWTLCTSMNRQRVSSVFQNPMEQSRTKLGIWRMPNTPVHVRMSRLGEGLNIKNTLLHAHHGNVKVPLCPSQHYYRLCIREWGRRILCTYVITFLQLSLS